MENLVSWLITIPKTPSHCSSWCMGLYRIATAEREQTTPQSTELGHSGRPELGQQSQGNFAILAWPCCLRELLILWLPWRGPNFSMALNSAPKWHIQEGRGNGNKHPLARLVGFCCEWTFGSHDVSAQWHLQYTDELVGLSPFLLLMPWVPSVKPLKL